MILLCIADSAVEMVVLATLDVSADGGMRPGGHEGAGQDGKAREGERGRRWRWQWRGGNGGRGERRARGREGSVSCRDRSTASPRPVIPSWWDLREKDVRAQCSHILHLSMPSSCLFLILWGRPHAWHALISNFFL